MITLGSPFTGDPHATNAWRLYEYASGRRADEPHSAGPLSEPPPVPTTAIFSRTDGICAWQCCMEQDGPQTESIQVDGSHCGLAHHPAAVYAIADRLAQPEDAWKPFDRLPMPIVKIHPDDHLHDCQSRQGGAACLSMRRSGFADTVAGADGPWPDPGLPRLDPAEGCSRIPAPSIHEHCGVCYPDLAGR